MGASSFPLIFFLLYSLPSSNLTHLPWGTSLAVFLSIEADFLPLYSTDFWPQNDSSSRDTFVTKYGVIYRWAYHIYIGYLADLKPPKGLDQDFEFRWASRNYSSYVFSCWNLSRYILRVFSRCALPLSFCFGVAYTQGLLSSCYLVRLSCRGYFKFWMRVFLFHTCLQTIYQLAVHLRDACGVLRDASPSPPQPSLFKPILLSGLYHTNFRLGLV